MEKIRRNENRPIQGPSSQEAGPPEIPAWLERVQARLRTVPHDPARTIFLERAFDAVVEITRALPLKSLEQTAAADNNVMVLFRALLSPQILSGLEQVEPLAAPYLRGWQAQQELLKLAGGTMTSEQVAQVLRLTRQAVDKRRNSGKLIAIPQGQHKFVYPACQFGERGPLMGLEEMLAGLGDRDAWMQLTFLLSPNSDLDGKSPHDLLRQGKSVPVVEAAARFGEQGAQ